MAVCNSCNSGQRRSRWGPDFHPSPDRHRSSDCRRYRPRSHSRPCPRSRRRPRYCRLPRFRSHCRCPHRRHPRPRDHRCCRKRCPRHRLRSWAALPEFSSGASCPFESSLPQPPTNAAKTTALTAIRIIEHPPLANRCNRSVAGRWPGVEPTRRQPEGGAIAIRHRSSRFRRVTTPDAEGNVRPVSATEIQRCCEVRCGIAIAQSRSSKSRPRRTNPRCARLRRGAR